MEVITNSRAKDFAACPYRHYLRYELKLRKDYPKKALRFGTNFHNAIDTLYDKGWDLTAALENVRLAYLQLPLYAEGNPKAVQDWQVECSTVRAMVIGYSRFYQSLSTKMESVKSEYVFNVPFHDHFNLSGKFDKVVYVGGNPLLMEHKTTNGKPDDTLYWDNVKIDPQVTIYLFALQQMGISTDTVIYDVVAKPSLRLSVANKESVGSFENRILRDMVDRPDRYFCQREITRTSREIEDVMDDIHHMCDAILGMRDGNRWYRNTSACRSPYPCDYQSVCFGGQRVTHDSVPPGFHISDTAHPELVQIVDEESSSCVS